jgi:hypothetical protein
MNGNKGDREGKGSCKLITCCTRSYTTKECNETKHTHTHTRTHTSQYDKTILLLNNITTTTITSTKDLPPFLGIFSVGVVVESTSLCVCVCVCLCLGTKRIGKKERDGGACGDGEDEKGKRWEGATGCELNGRRSDTYYDDIIMKLRQIDSFHFIHSITHSLHSQRLYFLFFLLSFLS